MSRRVAVIGGGPAGLMGAIKAAEGGAQVVLYERMARPGLKLAATGGGRGNFTNVLSADEMTRHGFLGNWRFAAPALRELSPEMLRDWFALRGVPSYATDGFHYFPKSEKASDLVIALLTECQIRGIQVVCDAQIEGLKTYNGSCCGVEMNGETIGFDRVIIAGGGRSYPKLGSNGSAYSLAKQIGHTIISAVPALGALKTQEKWVHHLPGIVLDNSALGISDKDFEKGIVLFTHEGISGPAVLDWCGRVNRMRLDNSALTVFLRINAQRNLAFYQKDFADSRQASGITQVRKHLTRFMPQALTYELLNLCKLEPTSKLAQISGIQRELLLGLLDKIELTIIGSDSFERAAACDGGVCTNEVNPKTLESKIIPGVFFAGEVLDVNGRCGGYHLQWAFSSGALAGISAGAI